MVRKKQTEEGLDLSSQPSRYLDQENELSVAIQKRATKAAKSKASASDSLEVQALFSMPAFVELLSYHGGWGNFSQCHEDLCSFLTSPQLDESSKQRLFFQGQEKGAKLRRMVLMPRGHLKSTIGTTLYVMWRLYRNPELRIFVGSNKQTLSYSFIRELRQYFENEELQKKVWNNRPHISGALIPELNTRNRQRNRNTDDTDAADRKLIWNNTALQMVREGKFKEPSVTAGSVGSPITGQHYDLVILDDIVDFKNTESEVRKERVEEWIQDVENVLNPPTVVEIPIVGLDTVGGEMVISGTRYAVDDYYGFLIERLEELDYVSHFRNIYANGEDASDGFLWHERYNEHSIAMLQARLSPRRFSSQYLNRVYEKDVSLLDLSSVTVIPHENIATQGKRTLITVDFRTEEIKPIVVVDPAFSASKDGDDCAIICGAKLNDGRYVVIDASVERMEAAEVVKTVVSFCKRYNTLRMYHESNGVGMLVPELFKGENATVDGKRIIVNSHYEQRPKEGKIQGVLELPFALGKMVFSEKVWDNPYLHKQLKNYPAVRHDDYLDALVTLIERTVPNRTQSKGTYTKGLRFSSMNADYLLESTPEQEKTLLGNYNAYYR
jgi:predicted phage terminase large subunit-like protein